MFAYVYLFLCLLFRPTRKKFIDMERPQFRLLFGAYTFKRGGIFIVPHNALVRGLGFEVSSERPSQLVDSTPSYVLGLFRKHLHEGFMIVYFIKDFRHTFHIVTIKENHLLYIASQSFKTLRKTSLKVTFFLMGTWMK